MTLRSAVAVLVLSSALLACGGGEKPITTGEQAWDLFFDLWAKPTEELSAAELRLVALGSLVAEVDNGGFHQYFFNSAGDLATVAVEVAPGAYGDLLTEALDRFPDYSPDIDVRRDRMSDTDLFDDLDERFYDASVDIDAAMVALAAATER